MAFNPNLPFEEEEEDVIPAFDPTRAFEEEEDEFAPQVPAQRPVGRKFDPSRFIPKTITPAVEEKPQDNIFSQAMDIPINIGRGGVQGIKMMTDLLGADNPISKSLSGVEGYLADMLSAQAKDDQEEIARIMQEAEDKGFGEQLMAGIKAFSIAPVDIMSQAMGTMIPVVATGLAGSAAKLGAVGIRAVQAGVGAGSGAGMTKGNIYSEVKNELLKAGISEEKAEAAAVEAQSYGGKNLDSILLGAGLGALSTLGAESILTRILTRQGKPVTAAAITRALKGGVTEMIPEAAQAAEEQRSINVALQREGFDVPTTRGVVSAAAMEGLAGAAIGAPVGALERPAAVKPKTPAEENFEQTTDIARKVAESGAPATASVLQDQAAENIRQEELAKQLATELETEELAQPPAAPTERATEAPSATTTPLTTAVTEQIVPTQPAAEAAQPPPTDATQEILQQEGVRPEPQDRVEGRTPEGPVPSDRIPTPEGGEAQGQVINDLQSVAENTANREQISALSAAGLVDIIKGQPVINEDGEAILAQAQAPLPRLTPEERVAEIEGAPPAEASVIAEKAPEKPVDRSHLDALELGLSNARVKLSEAKTESERKSRELSVRQYQKEIADEKKFLGIPEEAEITDEELLSQLGVTPPAEAPAIVEQEPTISEEPQVSEIIGEEPAQELASEQEVDNQISETRAQIREFEKARKSEVAKDSPRKKIIYDLDDKIKAANESLKSLDLQKGQFELARRQQAEAELNEALQVEADKIAPRTATGPLSEEEATTLRGLRIDEQMSGKLSQISQIAKSRLEARESAPAPTIREEPQVSEMVSPAPIEPAPAKAPAPEVAPARLYLNVPFNRKEAAKSAGAKFDSERKLWYVERRPTGEMPPIAPSFIKEVEATTFSAKELEPARINAEAQLGQEVEIGSFDTPSGTAYGLKVKGGDWLNKNINLEIERQQAKVEPIAAVGGTVTATAESQPSAPSGVSPDQQSRDVGNAISKVYPFKGINNASEQKKFLAKAKAAAVRLGVKGWQFDSAVETAKAKAARESGGKVSYVNDRAIYKQLVSDGVLAPPAPVTPPPAAEAPAPEVAPAAPAEAAPVGIAVGNRIKLGKSPQTYTIQEVIPQTATERELGEQYYSVKNERTGEVQVVEKNDVKPVKAKGVRRMAATRASLWEAPAQEIPSAATSINAEKLPETFKRVKFESGTVNADIGGGRFDNATEALAEMGIDNVIYDPFNRPREWNNAAASRISGGKADTATVNSVLNVIKEPENRERVIMQAADAVKQDGKAYFLIYEGDSSGNSRITKQKDGVAQSWQEHRKAETYIPEISKHFGNVERRGNLIIASEPIKQQPTQRMAAEGRAEKVAPVAETDRYSFEDAVIEANKLFGGEIPPNFAIVTDSDNKEFEFKAAYDPNDGMVILNLAYIRNTDNLQDIISHELGHYLYGDPEFQSAFEGFWNAMTPEQQALGDEIIRASYNQNTGQIQMEEKQVRAFMSLIEEANAQPQWRKVLDAIKRWFNRVFGTEFQTTDRGALDVLAAGVKRFGSGEQIIRAEAQDVLRMAAEGERITPEQYKSRAFGNRDVGPLTGTPPGFHKMTDEIIKRDYFDSGTVSDDNTRKAFDLMDALTDKEGGYDYARSIVQDVAAKMTDVANAESISVAVVRLQNELFRYAVKLAIKGDRKLMKQLYLRANRMETGLTQTVERGARAIGARDGIPDPLTAEQKMMDPTIAAINLIQASDIEQVAVFVFGTQNPTKEQIQAVADALKVVEDVKMENEGEILDGLTEVETRVNVNLTKKIDEKIKKAGKKKKKVKDVVDSTDAGKEQFAEMSEEEAAAAIKRKAQEAISRKADNVIESLARTQADVYVWPQQRTNEVRTIVQQDLRQRPDMGRKEPWMNMLTGKLIGVGVSEAQAQTIAELVWRQHEINSMNREIAEMEKAAEFGSLGGIIQRIKDTPLIKQQGPDWREGVIRDYLREAGLSPKAAETAARLYNSIIIDRLAKAQQKAFEDTLNKSAPWKDYFARNARLAKGALEKIRLAVRTGALDPSRNLENVIAEQNGWTGFTDKQFQRLAELDEIISDPNVDDVTRTESIVEINKIVSDAKLPVRLRDSLGAYYTGQALMGIPTALVNIASPAGFAIRNLFTDIARYSTSDPKNIPIAFETFMESMRTWYDQVSYAFRTQIYRNDVVEYLAGNNTLRELFNKGKKQWGEGKYAEGFLNMSVGMAQITGRVLSSLDQGAITALESQNLTRYALEAMKMTNIPKDEQKLVARKALEARRKTKAQLVSEGMNADRAGVLADLEVRSLLMTELSRLNVDFTQVLESSINEALLSVGRNREISITGLDEENKRLSDKGLISYYPIHFLEQMAQSAARSSPGMQVFSRMLYGFALVPARVFHNVAWYSPYGFFRIWREKEAGKRGWEKRYEMSLGNELQYRQRLTDAIAGSIVMLGLAALTSGSTDDEDEDKAFRIVITGNGPDAATDRQFHDAWNKKWKPYSIHIVVNGTIIPINIGRGGEALFFPIMLAGALDDWKIKGKLNQARKSPQELNQAIEMGSSAFFALAQRGPFAAFTRPLFDASKEGRAAEELVGQLGFFGKTFIPGIGASVFRNISDMINDPVDRSSVTGSIYANTPMVGPLMGSKSLNALGQPTRVDDWSDRLFRLGVPVVFSFPKDTPQNELNELILKQGSGPSFPTRRVAQAAVGRPLSDQEFETYVREYGRVMSDKMFKNRKRLENMPVQQYDRELERYAQGFSIDGIPISGARDAAVRAVNRMAQ